MLLITLSLFCCAVPGIYSNATDDIDVPSLKELISEMQQQLADYEKRVSRCEGTKPNRKSLGTVIYACFKF